jgi:hypothetical protein
VEEEEEEEDSIDLVEEEEYPQLAIAHEKVTVQKSFVLLLPFQLHIRFRVW